MRKREVFTLTALAFSLGVIAGFLASPVKNGIISNIIKNYYSKEEAESEEAQSEAVNYNEI